MQYGEWGVSGSLFPKPSGLPVIKYVCLLQVFGAIKTLDSVLGDHFHSAY